MFLILILTYDSKEVSEAASYVKSQHGFLYILFLNENPWSQDALPNTDISQVADTWVHQRPTNDNSFFLFSGSRCTSSSPCNLSNLTVHESCQSGYIQTDNYPNNYQNETTAGWRFLNLHGYTNMKLTLLHFVVIMTVPSFRHVSAIFHTCNYFEIWCGDGILICRLNCLTWMGLWIPRW